MSAPTNNLCETCRWWAIKFRRGEVSGTPRPGVVLTSRPFDLGECRRGSPYINNKPDGRVFTVWPTTRHDEFCGRWSEIPKAPAPQPESGITIPTEESR